MNEILVNLGCGDRFHADWQNFDLHSTSPLVQRCDLSRGVPLPENHCDAVFNSAVLEHLRPEEAVVFIGECRRILKPGGILRIGVPDLERIARTYLQQLERAVDGEPGADHDYDWILLELLDQMIRDRPGGNMAAFIKRGVPNQEFVEKRIGCEYTQMAEAFGAGKKGAWQRFQALPPRLRWHKLRQRLRTSPSRLRRSVGGLFLSCADRQALREGIFRRSGEVHQWMYDRYSLPRLLTACGFSQVGARPAGESAISGWRDFRLDLNEEGKPIKPDLLYVECCK